MKFGIDWGVQSNRIFWELFCLQWWLEGNNIFWFLLIDQNKKALHLCNADAPPPSSILTTICLILLRPLKVTERQHNGLGYCVKYIHIFVHTKQSANRRESTFVVCNPCYFPGLYNSHGKHGLNTERNKYSECFQYCSFVIRTINIFVKN